MSLQEADWFGAPAGARAVADCWLRLATCGDPKDATTQLMGIVCQPDPQPGTGIEH
jgi:hypothetical protein